MINFGDTGLQVQYLQNFLKDNFNKNIHLSDEYDKDTHEALIEYLKLPEVVSCYEIKDKLIKRFTYKEENPPNKLIDGGGIWNFDFDMTLTEITFFNRPINQCFDNGLIFISEHIDELNEFCKQFGWYVSYYSKFNYNNDTKSTDSLKITITKESREQLLPVNDIIKMINFSTNDYLLNQCFVDENNAFHGFIQYSQYYKISIIPAKPGDTFTIAHGYKYPCEMAIAYTNHNLKELRKNDGGLYDVQNIVSHLAKSANGELNPEAYEIYTIPEDAECTYLLIQMPFKNNLISPTSKKIRVKIGDIDQDGIISIDDDNPDSDYMILKDYVESLIENRPPLHNLSGASLVAANINRDVDINGEHIINITDLRTFESKMNEAKELGLALDFGDAIYEQELDLSESDYDRLLVMYGNIEDGNKDNILNIPIYEYQSNPWMIHDSFISYILGATIHKYSHVEDITWLQETVRQLEPLYNGLRHGYYDSPEDFVQDEELRWDENKTLYKYYKKGLYTGYVLDNQTDIQNGNMRYEKTMQLSGVQILNGKWIENGEWTGKLVLTNGTITTEFAEYSLKEIIKNFQISSNEFYKNQSSEQIKFITGNIDPLTERRLKQALL